MPFIHIHAYAGRDLGAKKKMAQAMVKAASEVSGTPETAFTVVYEDIEDRDAWNNGGQQKILEPIQDKVLIRRGELV